MELGPSIRQLITVVHYSTFRRCVREEEGRPVKTGKGRPRIAKIIRQLVLQIASDTGWGYSRILGELKKLGVGKISRQSVKNILVEHGIDPGPKRGRGSWCEFLKIHAETRDHDGKFSSAFDRVFTDRSIQVKPVGPQAPNLNAFVERWIQSLKREALDFFIVFGLRHFDHIVSEFVAYYHQHRPHQGLGNRLIGKEENEEPPAVINLQEVQCETRLGGLLKHYYRAA